MTPNQIDAFKKLLIEKSDAHIAGGGRISGGYFSAGGNCYCPIGISCKERLNPNNNASYADLLSSILGFKISDVEMFRFIHGFDGVEPRYNDPLYALGEELRAKYI
jgi:hypothetical protein